MGPPRGRWEDALWDLLHVPAFFGVTWSLAELGRRRVSGAPFLVFAIVGALVLSGGTELIQGRIGRMASWKDFLFNGVGVALGVAWILARRRPGWIAKSLVAVAGILALGACLYPAWGAEWADGRMRDRLPDIGAFGTWESGMVWKTQGNASAESSSEGLLVEIGPGQFGGVSLWPGGQDWSPWSELELEIENPGEGLILGVRIDDGETRRRRESGWFSSELELEPGSRTVRLRLSEGNPPGRDFDFSSIHRLALFTAEQGQPARFRILSATLR